MARFGLLAAVRASAIVCILALAACAEGGGQEAATPAPSPAATAAPSPSGSATVAAEEEPLGAYVVSIADGRLTRLVAGQNYSVVFWSRDGTAVTLARGEQRGDQDIYQMKADGSEPTQTATVDGWVGPWSPTSRAIIRYEVGRDQGTGVVRYGLYVTSPGARHGRWVADGFLGVWSPDGERIAFVGNFCDEERNYVGVVKADGSDLVNLTNVDSLQVGHAWSPDGKSLAFSAPDDTGVPQIYLSDAEGRTRVKLTDGPSPKMRPAWSADGAVLSFAALEGEEPVATFAYWVVPKEGGGATPLPAGMGNLAWSPQGRQLAFTVEGALQVLDLEEGGKPKALAQMGGSDEVDFQWSPDGRHIAFTKEGQLHVVGIDGSGEKQLTSDAFLRPGDGVVHALAIDSILWSPGGTKIGFTVVRPGAPQGVCS